MNIQSLPSLRYTAALCGAVVLALGSTSAAAATADESAAVVTRLDQEAASADGAARVEARLAADFGALAGSPENAQKLVRGLRDGTAVALTSNVNGVPTNTTITPTTGRMGYGNTAIALALAQESLAKAGVANPTPAQLQAALSGGSVTNASGQSTNLQGVLALRAAGQGWGQIAQAYDVRLGAVVSRVNGNGRGRGDENKSARGAEASAARGDNARAERPVTPNPAATNRGNGNGNAGANRPAGVGGGMGGGVGGGNAGGNGGGRGR